MWSVVLWWGLAPGVLGRLLGNEGRLLLGGLRSQVSYQIDFSLVDVYSGCKRVLMQLWCGVEWGMSESRQKRCPRREADNAWDVLRT